MMSCVVMPWFPVGLVVSKLSVGSSATVPENAVDGMRPRVAYERLPA